MSCLKSFCVPSSGRANCNGFRRGGTRIVPNRFRMRPSGPNVAEAGLGLELVTSPDECRRQFPDDPQIAGEVRLLRRIPMPLRGSVHPIVGVGEGPEIIQMFGRGVRLKDWNMSLKRHRESGADLPPDSAELQELETLYTFGLRANYMQTLRELLQAEGMRVDRVTIILPVTWNFGRQRNLKLIRLQEGPKYEHSDHRPVLPNPGDAEKPPVVEVDLPSRLQVVASTNVASSGDTQRPPVKLDPRHVALFDRTRIRDALTVHKQRMGWHNLVIRPETVDRLLENDGWYVLHAPPGPEGPGSIRAEGTEEGEAARGDQADRGARPGFRPGLAPARLRTVGHAARPHRRRAAPPGRLATGRCVLPDEQDRLKAGDPPRVGSVAECSPRRFSATLPRRQAAREPSWYPLRAGRKQVRVRNGDQSVIRSARR